MAKLSSTSIDQNKEYIKQLKKQRTKQLRREIKILDEEKAFKENDITSIETNEDFKDESEDIYQIYLKMGILKPAEKTEGQKWLDEINNLLKEKIVNTATIDKMTKILYSGSYWDFKYKSFEGYRDAIQKGRIPKAEDTVIDSIVKSVMKDLSYLNLTPISPDSRITEINKLFDRGLEIRSFLDRQKAILEKITKSNPEKDQPLLYSGNPNLFFDFNEYSFQSNTDIDNITNSKNIKKEEMWIKPASPYRDLNTISEKRIKFNNIILDEPTRVIVQARKQEEEYKVDKNRVIEIEKNFLRDSFLEEITQGKDFLTVEEVIKYVTLSGREAIYSESGLNPTTFIDNTTKSKNLSKSSKDKQLVVRKPTSRSLVVPEMLQNTTLDKLVVDVSNDDVSYLDDSDAQYVNDKHRQIPEYNSNIKEVILDNIQPKQEIKAEEKIKYQPLQNRSVELGTNLKDRDIFVDNITPKIDLEELSSNNDINYRPSKNRKIEIDRNILNVKIGVDEILEKQEQLQNEEHKKMINDYKQQISRRHKMVRENIKNNIFDHKDPIQVSREKEVKSTQSSTNRGNTKSDSGGPGDSDIDKKENEDISKNIIYNKEDELNYPVENDKSDGIPVNPEKLKEDLKKDSIDVEESEKGASKIEETTLEFQWEDEVIQKEAEIPENTSETDTEGGNSPENSFADRFGDTNIEEAQPHIKEIDTSMIDYTNKRSNIMDKFEGIDINLDDFNFDDDTANFKDVGGKIMPDSFVEEKELDLDSITEEELMENYEKQRELERNDNKDEIESAIINTNPVKMGTPPEQPKKDKDLGKRRVKKEEINIDDLLIDDTPVKEDKLTETIKEVEDNEPDHTDVTIDELLINNENEDNKPIDTSEVGLDDEHKINKLNPSNMTGSSEEKVQNILSKIFLEVDDEMGELPDLSKLVSTTTREDENDYDSVDDILNSVSGYDDIDKEDIDDRKDTLVEDIRTKTDVEESVIIEDTRTNKEPVIDNVENNELIEDDNKDQDLDKELIDNKTENTEDLDKNAFKEEIISEIMSKLSSDGGKSVKIKDALDTLTDLLKEKRDIPEEYRDKLTTFAEFLKKDNLLIQDYDSQDQIGESVKAPTLSYEKEDILEPITDLDDENDVMSVELDKLISLDLEEINNNIDTEVLEENIISDLDSINQTTSMASQDTIDFVKIRQAMDNMLKNSWEIELGLRFNFIPSEKVISKLNEYNLEVEQLGNGDCIVFYKKMDIKYLERRPSYHDFMTELKIAVTNLLKTAMKQKVRLVNKNFIPKVTEEEIKIMQKHLTKLKLGIDGKDLILDIKLDN